jgi:hypothetical protein
MAVPSILVSETASLSDKLVETIEDTQSPMDDSSILAQKDSSSSDEEISPISQGNFSSSDGEISPISKEEASTEEAPVAAVISDSETREAMDRVLALEDVIAVTNEKLWKVEQPLPERLPVNERTILYRQQAANRASQYSSLTKTVMITRFMLNLETVKTSVKNKYKLT